MCLLTKNIERYIHIYMHLSCTSLAVSSAAAALCKLLPFLVPTAFSTSSYNWIESKLYTWYVNKCVTEWVVDCKYSELTCLSITQQISWGKKQRTQTVVLSIVEHRTHTPIQICHHIPRTELEHTVDMNTRIIMYTKIS